MGKGRGYRGDVHSPDDGVGLARLEFIINNYIKVHPMALLRFDRQKDEKVKREIESITAGYEDKTIFFVDRLGTVKSFMKNETTGNKPHHRGHREKEFKI